ncbi:hypothetical protein CSZ94_23160 [Janthinobacterium sp. ROICE36]|nr:hypothetical protein CSZ94_23160 [Janthinobacterium sp. ROICE36]
MAAAIHVRKRTDGRGGGTEALAAGFAGGALAGTKTGGGTGLGADCGAGGGTGRGGTTGTGGGGVGMRGTGGGTTFCKTMGSAAWRVPQNGQQATRSSNSRPQVALMQRSFTFSSTVQPFPGCAPSPCARLAGSYRHSSWRAQRPMLSPDPGCA